MGAFRYPGTKTKLARHILRAFPARFCTGPLFGNGAAPLDYREPFFGAGGVGLPVIAMLPHGSHVWINDADPGIANYWRCIVDYPQELSAMVLACRPTVARYRACLMQAKEPTLDSVTSAFCTLFLHQCSYSGLGKKAGSPMGGWDQETTAKPYDVTCRWNAQKLVATIQHWHTVFREHQVKVTCGDFEQVFSAISCPERTLFYCDPPYVQRGEALYTIAMTQADHRRLAQRLLRLTSPWLLSYDDDGLVQQLYEGCVIERLPVRYIVANGTTQTHEASVIHELLIRPPVKSIRQRWSIVVPGRTGYHYTQLARQSGLPATTIRNRIRRGWTMARALQEPVRDGRRPGMPDRSLHPCLAVAPGID